MKKFINKVKEISEKLNWNVNIDDNMFAFSKYSPSGQDFNFSEYGENLEELINNINSYCQGFDCSEETFLWLDNFGHGKNGAPYDMKDLYEDMEACLKMVEELREELKTLI